ncbi:HNH endonuclease [Micrococcus lylae]|uniref:HNH endonuclease n=1 Tax=Micrococcus lylae TaxID=1273 RepID=UPI003EBC3FB9
MWKNIRRQVIARAKRDGLEHCPLCRRRLDWTSHHQPDSVEVDHIVPHVLGGRDHIDNARAICRACNQKLGGQARRIANAKRAQQRRRNLKSETLKTTTQW